MSFANTRKFEVIFQKAKAQYPELEHTDINVTFHKGWFFTMQASIQITSLLSRKRKYKINVNSRRENILSQLSDEDILGWFGHELAHIINYERMSGPKFLMFTLRYILDFNFRFSVEKRVSAYAYNNGFAKELFGVWKKFLVINKINKKYQGYIIRNYAPSWKEIREAALQEGITEETYQSLVTLHSF